MENCLAIGWGNILIVHGNQGVLRAYVVWIHNSLNSYKSCTDKKRIRILLWSQNPQETHVTMCA